MNSVSTSLNEAERYAVWCEETRALFARAGSSVKTDAVDLSGCSDGGSVDDHRMARPMDDFPYCFYMRMLSSERPGAAIRQSTGSSSSSDDSGTWPVSRQQQQQQQYSVDEDALSARIASKMKAHARLLRKEQRKEVSVLVAEEGVRFPFRDGTVEAVAAKVNEELHEVLMYVRRRNMLAEQLRQQLVQTRQLLRLQKGATS